MTIRTTISSYQLLSKLTSKPTLFYVTPNQIAALHNYCFKVAKNVRIRSRKINDGLYALHKIFTGNTDRQFETATSETSFSKNCKSAINFKLLSNQPKVFKISPMEVDALKVYCYARNVKISRRKIGENLYSICKI
jgi:hypothetical protein